MTWVQNNIEMFKTHKCQDKLNKKGHKNKERQWCTIACERYMLGAFETECTKQKDKQDNGGKMRI